MLRSQYERYEGDGALKIIQGEFIYEITDYKDTG